MNDATLDMTQHMIMCPRCQSQYFIPYDAPKDVKDWAIVRGFSFPALSRVDNKTDICSPCGTVEAMDDFTRRPLRTIDQWPVRRD
jgi:hypothetical protein